MLSCAADVNSTVLDVLYYKEAMLELVPPWILAIGYIPWVGAMIGSLLVGLSGVLPLLVIPIDQTDDLRQGGQKLRFYLCWMFVTFWPQQLIVGLFILLIIVGFGLLSAVRNVVFSRALSLGADCWSAFYQLTFK